ncbi:LOW QUALITY PROTEIN: uncharacterized protein LOC120276522 [Dioscorea cayenensis subsp. rotundata]|uniref:LOW QUALITY PROTEIN: uncharacterized protein LOC120276522 n=1 Tax=Dioscorea cayennensis subsp. rotundata TaxID=55577 RepID=A0AB40CLY9_DIOCR|nr:LOW QUALITY PROTEIN: uncharacterized protein LOC120276522 [Dioscorea cayenensis subsp. rotundata]
MKPHNNNNNNNNTKNLKDQTGFWSTMKPTSSSPPSSRPFLPRFMIYLIISLSLIYFSYSFNLLFSSSCHPDTNTTFNNVSLLLLASPTTSQPPPPPPPSPPPPSPSLSYTPTGLQHIVFGIAASSRLWDKRKEYIKIWWRPHIMRGYVWLDKPVKEFKSSSSSSSSLPILKISSDTSSFPYTHKQGSRAALRLSRIVSETLRLNLPNVRWFVMGDDDTVFFPDNLVHVLSHYDHRQPYYIGSLSESHLQNIYFSYGMAYGGGGFAISRPLAESIARMQDGCLRRYPALYGSDDRIQACMAELGVPLTRHPGFHQYDVYGDLLGLLAAHPVAPLISLHHLDVVQPIFPSLRSRPASVRRLFDGPVKLDSAGVMQQSICYEKSKRWTVSVSWGFVVQIVRGVISPREMETPARTFLNWYRRADYTAYAFNTRPVARNPCQKPFIYYLSSWRYDRGRRTTVTTYSRHRQSQPKCRWHLPEPSHFVDRVVVTKKPDPSLWDRAPRRNCCRVTPVKDGKRGKKVMNVEVGVCRDGEISEI